MKITHTVPGTASMTQRLQVNDCVTAGRHIYDQAVQVYGTLQGIDRKLATYTDKFIKPEHHVYKE